jgi:hypothetical protein
MTLTVTLWTISSNRQQLRARSRFTWSTNAQASWNMMAPQEPDFVFRQKRTIPFKSAGVSVQSTTGSRSVRISGSNAGYTMFRGRAKSTGYPLHSPVSPSLPLPCVTVCHHISTGLYQICSTTVVECYICSWWINMNAGNTYTTLLGYLKVINKHT